ncbi:MAG: HEAT repeat domain-containing protein, partial [Limisphaerales bacterium]
LERNDSSQFLLGYNSNLQIPEALLNDNDKEVAAEVVRKIGTTAIPYLLIWSKERDSSFESFFRKTVDKFPRALAPASLRRTLWNNCPGRKRWLARTGFKILGTNALSALPDIANRFNNSTEDEEIATCGENLPSFGAAGLDVLIAAVQSPHRFRRGEAIQMIGFTSTNAVRAVPVLLKVLNGSDDENAAGAAWALAQLAIYTDDVIPALTNAYELRSSQVRSMALYAIGQFGAEAKPAFPTLQKALADPSTQVREAATNALQQIDYFTKHPRTGE